MVQEVAAVVVVVAKAAPLVAATGKSALWAPPAFITGMAVWKVALWSHLICSV